MTKPDDTAERVRKIITDHLGVDDAPDESGLIADLGADSLDLVEMVMSIEEEFGIEVSDEEMETVVTVADVIKVVRGEIPA